MSMIYKYLTGIFLVVAMATTIWYLHNEVKALQQTVSMKEINIKSMERGMLLYTDKNGTLHTQSVQMQESLAELQASKDATTKALTDSIKRWKIKASTVTQAGQIDQSLTKQTVIHYAPGSYTQKDTSYDFSTQPYITNKVYFTHDSATNVLDIKDTLTAVFHNTRETINPPKKFFLWRWFQRKQDVNQVDIVHANPYIHTTNQKFINVYKK